MDSTSTTLVGGYYMLPIAGSDLKPGAKCILGNKAAGTSTISIYNPEHGWDHYYPAPKFPK